jgi:hypothetical protein
MKVSAGQLPLNCETLPSTVTSCGVGVGGVGVGAGVGCGVGAGVGGAGDGVGAGAGAGGVGGAGAGAGGAGGAGAGAGGVGGSGAGAGDGLGTGDAPAWRIVHVCPAIVRTALRDSDEVFRSIDIATVPFPLPVRPVLMPTQPAELVLLHAQPFWADTAIVCDPPSAPNDCSCRSIAKTHAAAAC